MTCEPADLELRAMFKEETRANSHAEYFSILFLGRPIARFVVRLSLTQSEAGSGTLTADALQGSVSKLTRLGALCDHPGSYLYQAAAARPHAGDVCTLRLTIRSITNACDSKMRPPSSRDPKVMYCT